VPANQVICWFHVRSRLSLDHILERWRWHLSMLLIFSFQGYNPVHVTPDGPKEIAVGAAAKAAALIGTSTTGVVIPAANFTGAATGDGLAASLPPNLDHR
jgi:hypothetical protein